MIGRRRAGLAVALVAACTGDGATEAGDATTTGAPTTSVTQPPPPTTTTTTTTTTAVPADASANPPAPNGRRVPRAASDPVGLAGQITRTELALRDAATPAADRPALGHLNQVAYRRLGREPAWDGAVLAAVPPELAPVVRAHVTARRALGSISRTAPPTEVPAWRIVAPEPAEQLLAHYRKAEAATGIPWRYLAAINLVESGFGRIRGLSTAGARGPMQFLPSTWNERGIGEGDIDDPHDAIQAAARYLVRRGGPADMARALRGYNNSAYYVEGVATLADLFRDERSFHVVYEWEIHYFSAEGDLWLPVGYHEPERIPVAEYLAKAPWSAPVR
jgi:hypothetical protein